MNKLYQTTYISKLLSIIIIFLVSTIQGNSQSFGITLGGQELSFLNVNRTILVNTGNNGYNVGSVHRYDNLITANGKTVYGIMRILDTKNATIAPNYFDDESQGFAIRFQPRILTGSDGGYILYELEFFDLITHTNVYFSDYFLTGLDVDGDDSNVEFYDIGGYSSYEVDSTSMLTITPSPTNPALTRFLGRTPSLSGITFENTAAFIAKYPPITKIIFSMGSTGGTESSSSFSAQFGSLGGTFSTNITKYNLATNLLIDKTAAPATFAPGNNGQYSINVTNAANTASNVTLSDILPAGLSYVSNSTSVFIPASTTTKIVRDEFNSAVYTAQDGTGIWTTDWIDNDIAASTGTIYVSGGKLIFSNLMAGDKIERAANIKPSGSTSGGAVLSFNYDVSTINTSVLAVQLSTDGIIYTDVTGGLLTGTNKIGTFTYTLTPGQITNNTSIKFTCIPDNWGLASKIATIDNVQISYTYSKQDVLLTNGPGTLSNGVPPNLVAAADAIVLEPNVTMQVTFNVAVDCNSSGTISNTATANCTNLPSPVSVTVTTSVGPTATATPICSPPGISTVTASGKGSGQVYRWYDAASGGTLLYTGDSFITPSISSNTTYYVAIYTAASNCESTLIPVIAAISPSVSGTGLLNELNAKNGVPARAKYADSQSSVGFSVTGITSATSYEWTINYPGVTVVGPSDKSTIYYNFNNGGAQANVQICATPKNSCGSGTPVCKTIGISDGVNRFISGYVFHDAGGSSGVSPKNKVDGVGINSIGGAQLYAVLVSSNVTVNTTAIASDGSYLFEYLESGSGIYSVWITNTIHGTGTIPTAVLPPGGFFNGEINNDSGNTLTGNTSLSGIVTGLSAGTETNVNFGIELTNPTANNDNISVNEDNSIAFNVITNDAAVSGHPINAATVDLDPAIVGRQTTYSEPGKGNSIVDNLGVVTFTSAANYFGSAGVNYIVEADAGVSSNIATITVTVNPVNDVPSFTKGSDQSVCAGSGLQTVTSWATALRSGPPNESLQILSFTASNDNNSIFSVQPSVNYLGELTFTPHATKSGMATVSIQIQDDGGTDNGGIDISDVQTFTITVNPNADIVQTSGASTNLQNICINTQLIDVTYLITGGATGASITAGTLPSGVNGSYSSGTFTISGTPTSAGTFNYTVVTSGTCTQVSVAGVIIVSELPTISSQPSTSTQSICLNDTPTTLSVTANAVSGAISTYEWYSNVSALNTGGTLVATNTTSATPNTYAPVTTSVGTLYYYVVVSNSKGCSVKSNVSGGITVNALPSPPTAENATATYDGLSHSANATVAINEIVDWYTEATGATLITAPKVTNVGTSTAWAEAKNTVTGCKSATRTQVTMTVTKAVLTVTANNQTKVYGATNPALTFGYSGWVNGVEAIDVAPLASTTVTTLSNVGSYPGSVTLSGGSDNNYTFTYVAAKFEVTKAALTVTADLQAKVYGATNPELTFQYSGFLNGDDKDDLTIKPVASTMVNAASSVGAYYNNITLSGGVDDNYTFTYVPADFEITKAILTVTADLQSKIYGTTNQTLTFQYSGFINDDDKTDLTTKPVASTTVSLTSPVSLYVNDITLAGGVDNNYTFTYFSANFTVTKSRLTVTADAQIKECAAALHPPLTYKITSGSLVGEDAFKGSLTRDPGDLIGTYAINQGTLAIKADYELTFVGANLVISDHISPIAMVNNIVVQLDASGNAAITVAQIDNGSNDGCGIVSTELDKTNFDCTNVGANQVILTVTDKGGNISKANAIVTVQDKVKPVITYFPANQTVEVIPGKCTAGVNVDLLTATDNCGVKSVVNDFNNTVDASGIYPVGVTLVTWIVTDNSGNTTNFVQTITVKSSLIANDDNTSTSEDIPIIIPVLANELDCDNNIVNSTLQVTSVPTNGFVLVNTDGTVTYTPKENYNGTDQFIYRICDADGQCDNAAVRITVTSVNDPPLTIDDINTTLKDRAVGGCVLTNDSDPEGDLLTVNINPEYSGPSNGTVIINGVGVYTYTPNSGYSGTDSFVYEVCDNGSPALCAQAKVTIRVINLHASNNVPVAMNDSYQGSVNLQVAGNVISNDFDPDGDMNPNSVTLISSGPSSGTLTLNTDGTFIYVPVHGFIGPVNFEYQVCDLGLPIRCDQAKVTIHILANPVGNSTFATEDSFFGSEDSLLIGKLLTNDNDPQGDMQIVNTTPLKGPSHGTLVLNADGNFTYTPEANYNGSDQFIYGICDNGTPKTCGQATIYLLIRSLGNYPNVMDDFFTTIESVAVSGNVSLNDTPSISGGNIWTIDPEHSGPSNGIVVVNPDGNFIYTPNLDFHGSDTFVYKVCDAAGNCDQAKVTITITSVNDTPIVNDDVVTVNVDVSLHSTVIENDIKSNDGGNVWTLLTPASKGTVFFNPDGSFNYTPDADYLGSDSFTYKLCDSDGECDEAKVTITVEDVLLPNQIITPNGDNTNDTFIIAGIDLYPVNKVTIYNRWGNVVYQRRDYQNEWDGDSNVNSIGSKSLPIGTYFYLIDYGKNRHKTGFVYLDR